VLGLDSHPLLCAVQSTSGRSYPFPPPCLGLRTFPVRSQLRYPFFEMIPLPKLLLSPYLACVCPPSANRFSSLPKRIYFGVIHRIWMWLQTYSPAPTPYTNPCFLRHRNWSPNLCHSGSNVKDGGYPPPCVLYVKV